MAIPVTCPHCQARFTVSDKFAGQEGPCPKCKGKIKIPKLDEQVVIHAPDSQSPKGISGQEVLKPLKRRNAKFSWPVIVSGLVGTIVTLSAAYAVRYLFRDGDLVQVPWWLLAIGAGLLAPPLVWAFYFFLRDAELEPYRGTPLIIRVAICSTVYAAIWGLLAYLKFMMFDEGEVPEMRHFLVILPLMFVPGALASMATLDLDTTNSAVHYAGYLGATVVLRLVLGLAAF
ncbi:MAG TPA: hypothetical protein VIY86_05380 [Pirellulaceae bacterium]